MNKTLEVAAENERGLELLGKESLQLNPIGGTYPVQIPVGAKVLKPVGNQLAVEFYRANSKLNGNLRPPFKKIRRVASGVFFPDFYYELIDGAQT